MSEQNRTTIFLVLIMLLIGAAVFTLLPSSSSRINDLGYISLCPFAPWSTLSLLLLGGVVWAVRGYLRDQSKH